MSSAWVDLKEVGKGQWKMRQLSSVKPYDSPDPETKRVWWSDAGVHQDITFPVHPDPISGMHCWHQLVRVERAAADDRYGDIFVDTNLSFAVYQRWKALTRPAPGPGRIAASTVDPARASSGRSGVLRRKSNFERSLFAVVK